MGIVRMGAPRQLILKLTETYRINRFIETGTYLGETSAWATDYFSHVDTIELSDVMYDKAQANYGHLAHIRFHKGDSRQVLPEIMRELTDPALFWLDGHWSGGDTYGEEDECPLIEELEAINLSDSTHYIFIDDARLFTSPPQKPHVIENWPTISEVIDTLRAKHDYYIVIFEDNIIAVPRLAEPLLAQYCQDVNTIAWEQAIFERSRTPNQRAVSLMGEGLNLFRYNLGKTIKKRFRQS